MEDTTLVYNGSELSFGWEGPVACSGYQVKRIHVKIPGKAPDIYVLIPPDLSAAGVRPLNFTVTYGGVCSNPATLGIETKKMEGLTLFAEFTRQSPSLINRVTLLPIGKHEEGDRLRIIVKFNQGQTLQAQYVDEIYSVFADYVFGPLVFVLGMKVLELAKRMTALEKGKTTPMKQGIPPNEILKEKRATIFSTIERARIKAALKKIALILKQKDGKERDHEIVTVALNVLDRGFFFNLCESTMLEVFTEPPDDLKELIITLANEYADSFMKTKNS